MEEFYKPNLIQENPLPLEENDITYAKELLGLPQDATGYIPLKVEQDVVVQRISHDLYAKPESGFRELFNNEQRACRNAKKIFSANPNIVISLNPATRDLEIRGVDSTGMSSETFKSVYTVIGRSSNFSGHEIGQFGFGRIAYSNLSDIMVLETRFRTENGQTGEYAIMCKNGIGFNILPKPDIGHFGTTVKLVLRQEVNLRRLIEYIHDACAFSSVPTYLCLTDDLREPDASWRTEKYSKGLFHLNKTYQEMAEEALGKSYYHGRGKLAKTFHIALDGAELHAEFRVGESEYYDSFPTLLSISKDERILGSPIEIGIDLPFSYYCINVLDERKYQPTADRERLREESSKILQEQLRASASKEISSYLNVTCLKDYLALDNAQQAILLSKKTESQTDPTSVSFYLSSNARRLRSLLLQEVKVYGEMQSSRYARRSLSSLLGGRELAKVFYSPMGRFNRHHIEIILQAIPEATFFQLAPSPRVSFQETNLFEELLSEEGIQSIREYVTQNKHKLPTPMRKSPNTAHIFESVVASYSWGRFAKPSSHVETIKGVKSLPKNVIRLPEGSVRKYTSLLSKLKTTYKLVKDNDSLRGGAKLDEFVEALKEKHILTTKGSVKLNDLTNSTSLIHLYLYSDPNLAKCFPGSNDLKIFNNEDKTFEIAIFLTYHSLKYELDTEMAELFDSLIDQINQRIKLSSIGSLSRANFLRDYSWKKLGDSEILGSVIQVFYEIEDQPINLLFARAVEGSKDAAEVRSMRECLLDRKTPSNRTI